MGCCTGEVKPNALAISARSAVRAFLFASLNLFTVSIARRGEADTLLDGACPHELDFAGNGELDCTATASTW